MKKFFIIFSRIVISLFIILSAGHLYGQDTIPASPESVGIDSVKRNRLLIYPGFGVSLVRNDIAPVFYINLGLNHHDRYEISVNTSSFFFFERNVDKNYSVYR